MQKPVEYTVQENTSCWICTSHGTNPGGYPQKTFNGRTSSVARYMYTLVNGAIPPGMHIRHTCDNKMCINPDHLLMGTHKDNMQDMVDRKRHRYGMTHPKAILTNDAVKHIRHSSLAPKLLAHKYEVAQATIYSVRSKRTWKHL